jgi:beta-lactam-binding protein with PASTA domain
MLYLMPDLRGLEVGDAAARLRGAGILVASSEVPAGRLVLAQDPMPGEPIASGQSASLN